MWPFLLFIKEKGKGNSMKFSESLKKNNDFQIVYKSGRSYANKYLVMYVKENGLDKNRLGISVSKKSGEQCCQASSDKVDPRKLSAFRRTFPKWT